MNRINFLLLFPLFLALSNCQKEEVDQKTGPDITQAEPIPDEVGLDHYDISNLTGNNGRSVPANPSLTTHFQNWLNANGYSSYNFVNPNITGDSYGGKTSNSTPVNKQPVIFIHGNSDKAVGTQFGQSGWTQSLNYFLSQGYTQAELYAITWGDATASNAANNEHSEAFVMRIRKFIEAVLDYTGASKVDIICHSMGVTLSRKAVKGGWGYDPSAGGNYYVGSSLTNDVDTFVGIAGGNQGLVNCYYASSTPTCNDVTGFYPGFLWAGFGPYGVSDYLVDINSSSAYEGSYRYSIWSTADQIVGYGCLVYGKNTCKLPSQTGQKAYFSAPYGHFNLKDLTEAVQYQMVVNHVVI